MCLISVVPGVVISGGALVTTLGALVTILDALINGGTETPLG